MLKSCRHCGRIHASGFSCPKKPRPARHKNVEADRFRRSYIWQSKRKQILIRDFQMCRICNEGSYQDFGPVKDTSFLQVHHIEPLEECYDLRLEDDNLLTACQTHHRMAEDGEIPREYLHELAVIPPRWGRGLFDKEHQDQQQPPRHNKCQK